jgi:hypothetical protein
MSWRVAESLQTLLKQLNAAFPKRSKASDGSIGDAKHASRTSDHNPWVKDKKGMGVVTARDFTHDSQTGIDCNWLAETLVKNKDPRIKYIIWNKRICSSKTAPWQWRPYKGSNAHQHHLHLSVIDDPKLYDSTKAWALDFKNEKKKDDIARLVDEPATDTAAEPTNKEALDGAAATETIVTKETGDTKVEVAAKNEQDVNDLVKQAGPEPYNGIGFWATIKRDLAAAGTGNLSLQGISEYAQQASGWPPWVVGLLGKIAFVLVILTIGWFLFRLVHYVVDTSKKKHKTELEAMINTDITRKNIEIK